MSEPALIDDPTLLDRILRQFRVKGRVNPFQISGVALPVFDIGELSQLTPKPVVTPGLATMVAAGHSTLTNPHYSVASPDSRGLNDDDTVTNPGMSAVMAETDPLAAGLHDIYASISTEQAPDKFELQHRNAANSANISTYVFMVNVNTPIFLAFSATVLLNERFRWLSINATAGGDVATNVSAALSPLDVAT